MLKQRLMEVLPPTWEVSKRQTVHTLYSLIGADGPANARIRRLNVLYANDVRMARHESLGAVLGAFENDLRLFVAANCPTATFLHAGVVAWRGKAILIPGESFSGKTTLVRALLQRGATYYSDEYAVIDDAGLVHPFARPLSFRDESCGEPRKYEARSFGAVTGRKPLSVGLVLVTKYRPTARWRAIRLPTAKGALELLRNSVGIRNFPRETLQRIQRLVETATFVKSHRPEAREIAPFILRLVETSCAETGR